MLFTLLALTPLIPLPSTPFVFLILSLSILLSISASYLQNGAAVLASLFGPSAMQSLMSGQGAVGILVSLVQFGTNTVAVIRERDGHGGDEARGFRLSAGLFFGFSTLVMVGTLVSHAGLMRMRLYKSFMASHLASRVNAGEADENSPLLASGLAEADETREETKQDGLWDVAKMNWQYNFAVAFVFTVTLVGLSLNFPSLSNPLPL
jgi:solute carrier family 29 (equilibrative nucleoside transporter), member 1/2/3